MCDQAAGLDVGLTDVTVERAADLGVVEVEFGLTHRGLRSGDGSGIATRGRFGRFQLLSADCVLLGQRFGAGVILLGIDPSGLGLCECRPRLHQCDLQRLRIDFKQQIAGFDDIAVLEQLALDDAADLRANFDAFVDAIVKAKPAGAKGKYLRKIAVSSTMGPGVKVDVAEIGAAEKVLALSRLRERVG